MTAFCIPPPVVEEFAYGISSSRGRRSLAADTPLQFKSVGVQFFAEYHADVSVGDGDKVLVTALRNQIMGDRLSGTSQQWMTLGFRVRPIVGLILDGGVDIGMQSPGFQYGPPIAPRNVIFGAAYAY